jgi:hypothetical protein
MAGLHGGICAVSSFRSASADIRPHRGTPSGRDLLTGAVNRYPPKKTMINFSGAIGPMCAIRWAARAREAPWSCPSDRSPCS